nr:hypothetical protein [Tanacetum cinerariifolium]
MGLAKDGKLRHLADGLAWKAFDARYPKFASDPHSVRLGLASDGFNLFRTMSTSYSTWPVVLIPYNLPPWICMKRKSLILSSIIPGGKAPGDDINIYLIPLIKELKLLWKGVDAYDTFSKERFKLSASLLRAVNDFLSYANLSRCSTKGRMACSVYTSSTHSTWFLMRLKSYVHNKAQPEGSIAEGYIKEECLTFCARYFKGVETFINRPRRNDGIIPTKEMYMFNSGGRKLGKVEIVELDGTLFAQAHRYVLLSHPKIQPLHVPFVHMGESLKDDHFIIAFQARQVFYIEDPKDVGWWHIIMTKPRDTVGF